MKANHEVTTTGFNYKRLGMGLLIVGASCMLYLAQSTTWINSTIFNQAFFTQTIQENFRTEANRDAIATTIVDTALADRPTARRVLGDRLIPIMSGVLNSDLSNQLIEGVSNRAFTYATTPDRKDIVIDLVPIKEAAQTINNAVANVSNADTPDGGKLPDQIMILEKDTLPDISGIYIALLWLEPFLWFVAIGAFVLYLYLMRHNFARGFYNVGISVAVVAVLGLLVGGYLPPPLAAMVQNITLRPVVESIITAFIAPFYGQMWNMLILSLVAMGIFSQRELIIRTSRNLAHKLNQRLAKTN